MNITPCPFLPDPFTIQNDLAANLNKVIQQCLSAKKASASKKKLFLLPFFDLLLKAICCCDYLPVEKFMVKNAIKPHSKKLAYYVMLFAAVLPVLTLWKE
ncbi:hypothetical protein Ping_3057 [Psychromonas ingrahamii 37]|uniref:Uncharacterized protein n=1 Tax=Psychromonas ingrahamii (strain DSM 17664 / CCUG 51855 / 37) TaxID=357804 RepID=A1SZ42_PSYIN|nr:hypothetical protein [Psychromonas ingrahamii]ABM04757.1 hypothetical protein Ping_3057 [Psychromonas ingrahamii 37]